VLIRSRSLSPPLTDDTLGRVSLSLRWIVQTRRTTWHEVDTFCVISNSCRCGIAVSLRLRPLLALRCRANLICSTWASSAIVAEVNCGALRRGRCRCAVLGTWNVHGAPWVILVGVGEGIRAALMQYSLGGSPWPRLVPNLGIKALFELAGSDGQSRVVLNAPGVAWLGLVASCDNDDKR